jgi:hypothetical protein
MQTWMIVLCEIDAMHSLIDELKDWQDEGIHLAVYSTTDKIGQGYLFIPWTPPVSERFLNKLKKDESVLDYFALDTELLSTRTQPLPPQPE